MSRTLTGLLTIGVVGAAASVAAAAEGGLDPISHVVNHWTIKTDDGWWLWSSNQTMLVISGLVMLLLGPWLAREIGTGPEEEGHGRYTSKHPFAQLVEVIAVFLRDEISRPILGERTDRFMPFLWTLFFFILINNLLGLIPLVDVNMLLTPEMVKKEHWAIVGTTATQNAWVTGTLALVAFFVIQMAGIRELGLWGYLKHFTAGAPWYVAIIMVPIEIIGALVKPFALAIRLFANMTAGHTLMATLFGFVGFAIYLGLGVGMVAGVTVASAIASFALYFLEIFVAFLQAFIFMFLTVVFIGQLSHHDDHDHAHDDHAHEPSRAEPEISLAPAKLA